MMDRIRFFFLFLMTISLLLGSQTLFAAAIEPWGMDLPPAATEVMEEIIKFHDFLLIVITITTVFVFLLLLYCIFRFNERVNPEASRVSHNTSLEIIWTVIPILILVIITIPSFNLLQKQESQPKADIVIKAIGHQWYWEYEYVDSQFSFDSNLVAEKDLKKGQVRLLSVDNPLVVPVNKTVRVIITAFDVLHSFTVPSFGFKKDAVPGRLNETWFKVKRKGTFFGQCSELCGQRHAYMPIEVRVVSQGEYQKWLRTAKRKFAINENDIKTSENYHVAN